MKFKVRKTKQLQEPELEFWLEQVGEKIYLYASNDEEKYSYIILTIGKDGIRTIPDVPAIFGMPVDSKGRVGVNL